AWRDLSSARFLERDPWSARVESAQVEDLAHCMCLRILAVNDRTLLFCGRRPLSHACYFAHHVHDPLLGAGGNSVLRGSLSRTGADDADRAYGDTAHAWLGGRQGGALLLDLGGAARSAHKTGPYSGGDSGCAFAGRSCPGPALDYRHRNGWRASCFVVDGDCSGGTGTSVCRRRWQGRALP